MPLRAVILDTGHPGMGMALGEHDPLPLIPLMDRPFIQHVVEYLIIQGVRQFDFILSHRPEKIEAWLGDGTRWGQKFRFHLVRDPSQAYIAMRHLRWDDPKEAVLLGHADRLPLIRMEEGALRESGTPVLYVWRDAMRREIGEDPQWTGWACLAGGEIGSLPEARDEETLRWLLSGLGSKLSSGVEVEELLSVRSYKDVLASHRTLLDKRFPGLLLSGREAEARVWLSRNVSLHPAARLIPPVYIGENCRIGKGVSIGPYGVVQRDCILEKGSTVAGSVIFPGSYVGESLELADVLVAKERLVNIKLGAELPLADDFILGAVSGGSGKQWLSEMGSRACGVAILFCLWPLLLATALWRSLVCRPGLCVREVVCLPAAADEARWRRFRLRGFSNVESSPDRIQIGEENAARDFLFRFLPALIHVARGELRLVGVSPRTADEIQALPLDWKNLLLKTRAGVVSEAYVQCGACPTADELYACEAYQSVRAGRKHGWGLLRRYLTLVFKSFSAREVKTLTRERAI